MSYVTVILKMFSLIVNIDYNFYSRLYNKNQIKNKLSVAYTQYSMSCVTPKTFMYGA